MRKPTLVFTLVVVLAVLLATFASSAGAAKPVVPPGQALKLAAVMADAQIVDLTAEVANDLPGAWPGHQPFQAFQWNFFSQVPSPYTFANPAQHDGLTSQMWADNRLGTVYQTRAYLIDEHTGTHFDAPIHFTPPTEPAYEGVQYGLMSGEKVPLTQLMGPAIVVDVRSLNGMADKGKSPLITAKFIQDQLAANKIDLKKVAEQYGAAPVVLFWSGYDDEFYTRQTFNRFVSDVIVTGTAVGWPAPDKGAVEWLFDQGVRHLGIDGPSMGPAQNGYDTHYPVLRKGMIYSELLVNLDEVPTEGAYFMFLPLKVAGSTGDPGRAIAIVPSAD